jgi:outer membrane protein assembly factor BamA
LFVVALGGALALAGATPGGALAQAAPTPAGTVRRGDSAAAQPAPAAATKPQAAIRIFPLPVIGYAPETKTVGGLAVIGLRRRVGGDSADRPTTVNASAMYTQLDQVTVGAGGEYWSPGNLWRLSGDAYFARFPYRFYGIGGDTPDSLEERYTPLTYGGALDARRLVRPHLYVGGGYDVQYTEMRKVERDGLLDAGAIAGSEGGLVSAASLVTNWDTRNNIFWPSRGSLIQLGASRADAAIGSDFDFTRVTFDARRYVPVGKTRVLALQGLVTQSSGEVPFDRMAQLGGNVLRGYLQGRYRDKALAAVQAEFRTPVWRRLGAAVFGGVGQVGPRLADFDGSEVKAAGGFGLRYALSKEDRLNLRFDLGLGQNSSGTYVTLGEAF